jgi:hypothetical protein
LPPAFSLQRCRGRRHAALRDGDDGDNNDDGGAGGVSGSTLWVLGAAEAAPVALDVDAVTGAPVPLPAGTRVAAGAWRADGGTGLGGGLVVADVDEAGVAVHTALPGEPAFTALPPPPALPGTDERAEDPVTFRSLPGVAAIVGDGVDVWLAVADRNGEGDTALLPALPDDDSRGLRFARFDGAA